MSGSVLSIEPNAFANQMACLADKGFRGISLAAALSHHAQHNKWPERTVVLTFDDGFTNFYDEAFPVLDRHGFTATVFIVSGHMGGVNNWEQPPQALGLLPILSWTQAAELAKAGIEIGSHTRTHRDLTRCSPREASSELWSSRIDIREHLGLDTQSFAYPYGSVNNIIQKLAARDYRAACTTELRRAKSAPLNLLPRVDMYYLRSIRKFVDLLDGQLDQYLAFRRCGRFARRMLVASGF